MAKFLIDWHKWTRYRSEVEAGSYAAAEMLVTEFAEEAGESEIRGEDVDIDRIEAITK